MKSIQPRALVSIGVVAMVLFATGTKAAEPNPRIEALTTVTSASVGDDVEINVTVASDTKAYGIGLDMVLPNGMRPLTPPQGCGFRPKSWAIHCRVGSMARDERRTYSVPVLVTGSGFLSVDATLLRDGASVDRDFASIPVDIPDVVRRYAPQFRFAEGEIHWPMDVDDFVAASELRFVRQDCGGDQVVTRRGEVDALRLGLVGGVDDYEEPEPPIAARLLCDQHDPPMTTSQNSRPGGKDEFYGDARGPGEPTGFALGLDPARFEGEPPAERGSGAYDEDVPLYYQYRPGSHKHGPGYIRYWLFSGCSEVASVAPEVLGVVDRVCWHEGDWEGVAIRLDAERNEPTSIVYFAHETRTALPFSPEVIDLTDGTHPVVWVAEGSHASYPVRGDFVACSGDKCGTDVTGDSWLWDTWDGALVSVDGEPWYGYGGAWGNSGKLARGAGVFGPGGPGLVDPLGGAWLADRVEIVHRCLPGEQHPEASGVSSCAPPGYASWRWRELPYPPAYGNILDAEVLADGRILLITSPQSPGGECVTNIADPPDGLMTALFDPATDTWSGGSRTRRLNGASRGGIVPLPDGGAYLVGSFERCRECGGKSIAEVLDPGSGTWRRLQDLPPGPLGATWQTADGRVLGYVYDFDEGGADGIYELDPSSGRWNLVERPPQRLRAAGWLGASADGSIWVYGSGTLERYVPSAGASVRLGRRDDVTIPSGSWLLPDGRIAVRSGADPSGEEYWRTQVRVYDPETGKSSKTRTEPVRQSLIQALPDGRMLLGRPYEGTCPNLGAYEPTTRPILFDPMTGQRERLANLPEGIYNGEGFVLEDGRVLVVGNAMTWDTPVAAFMFEPPDS